MQIYHKITHLHQVIIIDSMEIPNVLSPSIVNNIDAAKSIYPDAVHKIWSGNDLRIMIRDNFESEVLEAFDTLIPYSFKCDLARYCLMYVYGGIYFDIAVKMINPWDIPIQYGAAAFTEMYPGMESWTCTQTSLLWSLPRRSEWKYCIDNIVQNCRERYYGPHDHYPTAGALLGKAFAYAVNGDLVDDYIDDQFMGEVRYITPERQQQNCTFVSPHRKLVGIRTKLIAGSLKEFSLPGTNSYVEQYKKRRIYHNERELIWGMDDLRFDIEERAILTYSGARVLEGAVGRVMYGPYVPLKPGLHKIVLKFSPDTSFLKLYVDIVGNKASTLISEIYKSFKNRKNVTEIVSYFRVDSEFEDVEFRMSVFGDFSGELQSISIFEEWLLSEDEKKIDVNNVSKRINVNNIFYSNIRDGKISLFRNKIIGNQNYIGRYSGICMYGPYIDLNPGNYEAVITFSHISHMRGVRYEICSDAGNNIIHTKTESAVQRGQSIKVIPFSIMKKENNVEVRIRMTWLSKAAIEKVEINKIA